MKARFESIRNKVSRVLDKLVKFHRTVKAVQWAYELLVATQEFLSDLI